jgi:hypothetical protein
MIDALDRDQMYTCEQYVMLNEKNDSVIDKSWCGIITSVVSKSSINNSGIPVIVYITTNAGLYRTARATRFRPTIQ